MDLKLSGEARYLLLLRRLTDVENVIKYKIHHGEIKSGMAKNSSRYGSRLLSADKK